MTFQNHACFGRKGGSVGQKLPSGTTFYEFNSALLGAHHGPPPWMDNCPEQLFGFERIHAFSELEFDATGQEPTATYRLIHQDGEVLFEVELSRTSMLHK